MMTNDKITKALETINELHGETLRDLASGISNEFYTSNINSFNSELVETFCSDGSKENAKTDANTICHDVDLLGDWLDSRGYTEEAGLCLRVLGLIHEQAEENEKLHNQAAMNGRLLTENAELREENRLVGLQMDRMADEIEKLQAENEKTKRFYIEAGLELRQLREDNKRLRAALKDLIEDHEYMTDTDAEEDNMARAAARAALKEMGDE